MLDNLKALTVVMFIAVIVFPVARPFCLRFMADADFVRRRNIWFALTIAAFVSPDFWIYVAIALPLLVWGALKDSNPLALYVLVYCVIPVTILLELPVIGINALFPLSNLRIVAFAILIPVAWQILHAKKQQGNGKLSTIEFFVLAYGCLHLALLMPTEAITQTIRRGFLYFLDIVLLYFVAVRACSTRKAIVEIMATFCLLCAIFASIAIFESQLHWLLYTNIGGQWGEPIRFAYVERAGSLRAQVTAGQAIPLGYMLALGFTLGLYLNSHMRSRPWIIAFGTLMWLGMIASHSRGPWIVAAAGYFVFLALSPNGFTRAGKNFFIASITVGFFLILPVGERVIDNLPFIGKVGSENVEYRIQILEIGWELIKQNPFFGDVFVARNLEALRQGQGIIDLVNAYMTTALYYGVIGLSLFLAPYVISISTAYRISRNTIRLDPDRSLLGAVLVACISGAMLMLAFGGFGPAASTPVIVLISLSVAYSRLDPRASVMQRESPHQSGVPHKATMKRW